MPIISRLIIYIDQLNEGFIYFNHKIKSDGTMSPNIFFITEHRYCTVLYYPLSSNACNQIFLEKLLQMNWA